MLRVERERDGRWKGDGGVGREYGKGSQAGRSFNGFRISHLLTESWRLGRNYVFAVVVFYSLFGFVDKCFFFVYPPTCPISGALVLGCRARRGWEGGGLACNSLLLLFFWALVPPRRRGGTYVAMSVWPGWAGIQMDGGWGRGGEE